MATSHDVAQVISVLPEDAAVARGVLELVHAGVVSERCALVLFDYVGFSVPGALLRRIAKLLVFQIIGGLDGLRVDV